MTETAATICDACKLPPYPPNAPAMADTGLPAGWVIRQINGRTFTLCDCCGSIRHFRGGISTYLQQCLGLPDDAQCRFDDEAGSGLHRTRVRR